MELFNELNKEQLEAVTSTEGYVRVIAGAGSGKTKTLTCRYIHLVQDLGISPNNILSVTFTNKAANEMKKRIKKVLNDAPTPFIRTFHGLAAHILKEEHQAFCFPKDFSIIDSEDQLSLLKECYKELNVSSKEYNYKKMLSKLGEIKNYNRNYVELLINENINVFDNFYINDTDIINNLFKAYLLKQRKSFYFDFDDLILVLIHIFQKFPIILDRWSNKFQYIQIDEYQDISKNESQLIHLLQTKHKNLFVVGDPDQTIYSWRGADIASILNFDIIYKNTKTIMLTKNYRSSSEILHVSNELIKHNKNRIEKELVSIKGNKTNVVYIHSKSRDEENEFVVKQIIEEHNLGTKYNDMAIIYRANRLSKEIEEKLISKNIPYRVYNGIEFYSRKEIKDSLAFLKLIAYSDDLSFERVINNPHKKFGSKRMNYLKSLSNKYNSSLYETLRHNLNDSLFNIQEIKNFVYLIDSIKSNLENYKKISDLLNDLLEKSGYLESLKIENDEDRLENIKELQASIKKIDETEEISLDEYLTQITLISNVDKDSSEDKVNLLTAHNAKGLEFSIVFIICLCENIFPSSKIETLDDMEEERRVAYVSYTRAKDKLYLLDNNGYDHTINDMLTISRFIVESNCPSLTIKGLKNENLNKNDLSSNDSNLNQNSKYKIGNIVYHTIFGKGVISHINDDSLDILFENNLLRSISKDSPTLLIKDKKEE